jgi:hypothetical protein
VFFEHGRFGPYALPVTDAGCRFDRWLLSDLCPLCALGVHLITARRARVLLKGWGDGEPVYRRDVVPGTSPTRGSSPVTASHLRLYPVLASTREYQPVLEGVIWGDHRGDRGVPAGGVVVDATG